MIFDGPSWMHNNGELAMADKADAWVWSQYKGVIPENRESSAGTETRSPGDERVVPFRPVPGSARVADDQKSTQRRT
jgi:hypothetical protein